MSTAAAVRTEEEVVTLVALKRALPSPTNPRKGVDGATLKELAASIKEQGILQPLVMRPWPAGQKTPLGTPRGADLLEIVVGHRRYYAAQLAGLEAVPAIVREMSDDEVLGAQLVENLQREDLHALEEAEGYRQLMHGKEDVARIAERTGRSVKYIYDRVKLLSLTAAAQKAFRDGRFTAGHAILLARLSPKDQKRAMEAPGALFTDELLLFTPEDGDRDAVDFDPPLKPRSVRELQGWIDAHVRLEAEGADPMLFPDLVETVKAAEAAGEKVVRITHDSITPEDAKGGPKLILGRSWRRADGKHKSKTCDRSVIGTVEIGPGRSDAFRVCVDKKHCKVHWGDLIKAAHKREREVAKAGGTGEEREALRRRTAQAQQAQRESEQKRWQKARPAILAALAASVKKAAAGVGGAVGKLVLEGFEDAVYLSSKNEAAKLVPAGKSAEDLVRHIAFRLLVLAAEDLDAPDRFAREVKPLGVDVAKILAAAAPVEARCGSCGCTEDKACPGGCAWVKKPDAKTGVGLCSSCAPAKTKASKTKAS